MDQLTLLIKTGTALVLISSTCFACPHGYFGLDCLHKCSTYCSGNGSCNPSTGVCNNGCKDGWSGSKCGKQNTACPHGYFGLDCLHKCSTYCSGNGSCNPSTGVCNNGCKDGWSGSKCGTEKDADGLNTTDFNIIGVVSGLVISIGVAVFSAWKKFRKGCSREDDKTTNDSNTSNESNITNNYFGNTSVQQIVNLDINNRRLQDSSWAYDIPAVDHECPDNVKRIAMAVIPTNEPLAINAI